MGQSVTKWLLGSTASGHRYGRRFVSIASTQLLGLRVPAAVLLVLYGRCDRTPRPTNICEPFGVRCSYLLPA